MSDNGINMKTVIIAVVISVIFSGVVSYMILPEGPEGVQGIQGSTGETGETGATGPPGPGLGELIFDSGWLAIDRGTSKLICTLDDTNVFVYMVGRFSYYAVHQRWYGGDMFLDSYDPNEHATSIRGAVWGINYDNELWVNRKTDDSAYKEIRVIVWQLP